MENLKRKMNCLVYDEDVDEDNNVCMFVVVADNFPRRKNCRYPKYMKRKLHVNAVKRKDLSVISNKYHGRRFILMPNCLKFVMQKTSRPRPSQSHQERLGEASEHEN